MKYPDYVNKILCGDCLEVMKGIPDNSINLVLTEPRWRDDRLSRTSQYPLPSPRHQSHYTHQYVSKTVKENHALI